MSDEIVATQHSEDSPSAAQSLRNAFHKFANKKKEKTSQPGHTASTGFFSRAAKGVNKQQALPGSVKQVCSGQLPPVWATPPPAPPRKVSSPTCSSTKSPKHESGTVSVSEYEEDLSSTIEQVSVSDSNILLNQGSGTSIQSTLISGQGPVVRCSRSTTGTVRFEQFNQLFKNDVVDLEQLRKLSWGGIPPEHRPNAWRILLGYMPSKQDRRDTILQRKRQEYKELLEQYYFIPDTDRGIKEQSTLRQILVDIPRTNSDIQLFQEERIHQCMERILYTWAIRHPASGYVQGINDLLTPFLVIFLSVFMEDPQTDDLSIVSDDQLESVEADSYWCLTKLLDGIQDHYTFAQPGLQRMVHRMEELVHRCDAELFKHIVEQENVQFVQFAFRWMNCLLMREVPLNAIIRLWDTYLCEDNGFESFHVYVAAATLMTFGEQLKTLEFQDLVLFLQHLPTKEWAEEEIDPLLSRAYILQTYFADSPSHLSTNA